MALGRGLASLIPNRKGESAEDIIERIDSMEVIDEERSQENTSDTPDSSRYVKTKTVNVVEDFEDLDDMEEMAPPSKPLVTPLEIDPDTSSPAPESFKTRSLKVEEEEEVLDVAEQQKEEPQEAPKVTMLNLDDIPVKRKPKAKREPLIPYGESLSDLEETESWDKHEEKIHHIPIGDVLINPLQPRRSFDPAEMEELQESIDQHGILQPLVVRRLQNDKGYELIAGERRLRAAKALKWDKVPCVIRRNVKSDQSRLVYALIENIQRENLSPVEEAMAYDQLNKEYGLTHEEIGARVGRSRVSITNTVRVLQLPAEVQRGLGEGKITIGHAKAILMIPDQEKQLRFYRHMLDEGLTVRKAETRARRVQRSMQIDDPMRKKDRRRHALSIKYSPALEERYGYDALIKFNQEKNRFEVIFRAYSEAEISELVDRLLGKANLATDQDQDVLES